MFESLFYVALFTAFLTAIYTFRALFMTFYGELRVPIGELVVGDLQLEVQEAV